MVKTNITKILNWLLCICKAFWSATITIIYGVAGCYFLTGLIVNFQQDTSLLTNLFVIIGYLLKYWYGFFIVMFLYDFLGYSRELNKEDKNWREDAYK